MNLKKLFFIIMQIELITRTITTTSQERNSKKNLNSAASCLKSNAQILNQEELKSIFVEQSEFQKENDSYHPNEVLNKKTFSVNNPNEIQEDQNEKIDETRQATRVNYNIRKSTVSKKKNSENNFLFKKSNINKSKSNNKSNSNYNTERRQSPFLKINYFEDHVDFKIFTCEKEKDSFNNNTNTLTYNKGTSTLQKEFLKIKEGITPAAASSAFYKQSNPLRKNYHISYMKKYDSDKFSNSYLNNKNVNVNNYLQREELHTWLSCTMVQKQIKDANKAEKSLTQFDHLFNAPADDKKNAKKKRKIKNIFKNFFCACFK